MSRLFRLRIVDTVADAPAGNPAVEVQLFDKKGAAGEVKLWPADDKTALAQSTRFKGTVSLAKHEVESLLKDLDAVLAEGK